MLGRPNRSLAPQKARHIVLEGEETCAEALALFVDSATAQIEANRRAVLETDDPEAAHQLRIGLRRLRSALRAFRPLNDTPATRELEQYARDLGRSVSELRNADVFIEHIFAPVAGNMKGEPGYAELRAGLLAHRMARRDTARQALAGDQWSRLQLYLALWPRTMRESQRMQAPVRKFAAVALGKGWKRVAKQGGDIHDLSLEQRHDMRKALKDFRYTAEFFGSLYEARQVSGFVRDLKKLQDVFGYVNDAATAKALNAICHQRCPDSREAQRAAGYVRRLARRAGGPRLGRRAQGLGPPQEAHALLGLSLNGIQCRRAAREDCSHGCTRLVTPAAQLSAGRPRMWRDLPVGETGANPRDGEAQRGIEPRARAEHATRGGRADAASAGIDSTLGDLLDKYPRRTR